MIFKFPELAVWVYSENLIVLAGIVSLFDILAV